MTALDVLKEVGGVAGLVALVLLVMKAVTDNKNARSKITSEALVLKAQVDNEALIAKAQVEKDALGAKAHVDNDALIAKAQVKKIAAETDEVIVRASDAMIKAMQTRVDALIKRVEISELKRDEQETNFKKRIDALEGVLTKKDAAIYSRDERIKELECKVRDQAQEIAQLQKKVGALEIEAKRIPG